LVCADRRCATLVEPDAELCDECGGSRLEPIEGATSLLCGRADERPVVFRLRAGRPEVIGRSTDTDEPPDIDLARFPSSRGVHRRHARLEARDGGWLITHLGSNPVLIESGERRVAVPPGASTLVRPGDTLVVGGVRLQLITPARSAVR
jgi:hypothetical protein